MTKAVNKLASDLEIILKQSPHVWEEMRGKKIFITGGTGFFGTWLLESIAWANSCLDTQISALVLTRNIEKFKDQSPHLAASPSINFHHGDVKDFQFPKGTFHYIIHAAATSAIETFNNADQLAKFNTVTNGTRRVLEFASQCGAEKFLYTSSGVVYGKQPPDMRYVPENYIGAPDPLDPHIHASWGESKRVAEFLCSYHARKYGFEVKIARCFSFVGPHLPLDIHYAIGNFIRNGLSGQPILIQGDGMPRRSYLYTTDLVIWLLTILLRGKPCHAYNVGSEEDVSIAELAHTVAMVFGNGIEVKTAKPTSPGAPIDRYVPSTRRAQQELGLRQNVPLEEAIRRTIAFYKNS